MFLGLQLLHGRELLERVDNILFHSVGGSPFFADAATARASLGCNLIAL
jgi:hypothetical protein